MTLEELLESSADELDKLDDKQLLEYFKPYFAVTRPEMARKASDSPKYSVGPSAPPTSKLTKEQQEVLTRLAAQGIDISFANRRFKK